MFLLNIASFLGNNCYTVIALQRGLVEVSRKRREFLLLEIEVEYEHMLSVTRKTNTVCWNELLARSNMLECVWLFLPEEVI